MAAPSPDPPPEAYHVLNDVRATVADIQEWQRRLVLALMGPAVGAVNRAQVTQANVAFELVGQALRAEGVRR